MSYHSYNARKTGPQESAEFTTSLPQHLEAPQSPHQGSQESVQRPPPNLVKRPSASQILKRKGTNDDDPASNESTASLNKESRDYIAPSSRTPSWSLMRRPTPSLNTAIVSMTTGAASIDMSKTQVPKTDAPYPHIVGIWWQSGGPPVAALAALNHDDDDDYDRDDSDMKVEPKPQHTLENTSPSSITCPGHNQPPSESLLSESEFQVSSLPGGTLFCTRCQYRPKGKPETLSSYLVKHMKIHERGRIFCPKCGAQLTRKDNMMRHQRGVHRVSPGINYSGNANEPSTNSSYSQSVDVGAVPMNSNSSSAPLPQTASKSNIPRNSSLAPIIPETTFDSYSISNSLRDSSGLRPMLRLMIPEEQDELRTLDTVAKPIRQDGNEVQMNGFVPPPPSPSASALLSAGATGPPNPFARPPYQPQQSGNISVNALVPNLPSPSVGSELTSPNSLLNNGCVFPNGVSANDQFMKPTESRMLHAVPEPTDSGYGTIPQANTFIAAKHTEGRCQHYLPGCVEMKYPEIGLDRGCHDDEDECNTVYTGAEDLYDSTTQKYIKMLAKDLFRKVGTNALLGAEASKLASTLPGLIQAVAFKLGYKGSEQIHRDIMVFLHRHR